jgi:hypothetical protein
MQQYTDRGLLAAADVAPTGPLRRGAEIWPASLKSVAQQCLLPPGLIHSDVHPKNWYITKEGKMGLSDAQCMNIGHGPRPRLCG